MRFTLSLSDYMDQYISNNTREDNHCPICYERVCGVDIGSDLKHMLDCYKEDVILNVIVEYQRRFGEAPAMTSQFVERVEKQVASELASYCESHRKIFDLLD
jgi:hypothetical protein